VTEVKEVVLSIYNKTNLLKEDFAAIMELLKHDKKNVNGQVNFVLLNDYEDYKLDCKVSNELIVESLEFYNL
ncbi:MAG: 3-dehydroquinate synthase, partial [Polaribacter sp.]